MSNVAQAIIQAGGQATGVQGRILEGQRQSQEAAKQRKFVSQRDKAVATREKQGQLLNLIQRKYELANQAAALGDTATAEQAQNAADTLMIQGLDRGLFRSLEEDLTRASGGELEEGISIGRGYAQLPPEEKQAIVELFVAGAGMQPQASPAERLIASKAQAEQERAKQVRKIRTEAETKAQLREEGIIPETQKLDTEAGRRARNLGETAMARLQKSKLDEETTKLIDDAALGMQRYAEIEPDKADKEMQLFMETLDELEKARSAKEFRSDLEDKVKRAQALGLLGDESPTLRMFEALRDKTQERGFLGLGAKGFKEAKKAQQSSF